MLTLPPSVHIWMASKPVDLRRGIDGLLALVRTQWATDPYSGHLFVFVSRGKNRVKILYWDRGGFVVFYKRLELGTFRLPKVEPGCEKVVLSSTDLAMLLDGNRYQRVKRPAWWKPSAEKMG